MIKRCIRAIETNYHLMKRFFFLPFLMLWTNVVLSGTDFTLNCRNAFHEIICLHFNDARSRIDNEKAVNPSNTIPYLLDNYIDFLKVMIGEEHNDLEKMRDQQDFRLQHLAKGDPSSPWYLYSQADVFMQWGFAKAKFGEYISAGIDINRAFRLLEENDRKFHDFTPNKIRLGLLHALVGTVPDKYQWAIKALDFKGTIPQGLGELRSAYASCLNSKKYGFMLPESIFLLSFVSINLSGDKSVTNNLAAEFSRQELMHLINQSPLVLYSWVNLKIKSGKNDDAIKAMSAFQKHQGSYPFCYLDYLLGVSKLDRLDQDAYLPLMKFVAEFRGMNYIRAAYEHLAWYYLVQGNMEMYWMYMNRIKLRGSKSVDNDKQALADADRKTTPDPFLLKARLLFDGGYYEKALAELTQFASSPGIHQPRLKLEYTYRTARVFDEWNKTGNAIHWYDETIKLGEDDPSYFAANASLHLGLIYENKQQFNLATSYYQKCLDMDFEEYNFSISQKAKSGLNRIKNQ
jgi:tetratricopeptide (TPR) repeat protein